MNTDRYGMLRDLLAFLIVAAACPIALFGGSMLGCLGQGFSAACATSAIAISPVILVAAGAAAGFISRGWTGLLIGFMGNLAGMTAILVLSFGVDKPVPLDPISGIIAMVWFGFPSLTGYGIGWVIWRLARRRGSTRA
ncbi:MAG: hypothetical protein Q8M74_05945 [Chloroflexota bacterium]|nr:hypothetical protein [Chloroflexota bacterium]